MHRNAIPDPVAYFNAAADSFPVTFTQPQPGTNPKRHAHAFAIRVAYAREPVAFGSFTHRHAARRGHSHRFRESTGPALYAVDR